jgi:outer membrane protein assembly factor BamD (BamD/ComL family)
MALRHRTSRVALPAVAPSLGRDVSLAEESALLEEARSDLLRGSASGALQALATHERRFPAGRMVEQREALTIQALVDAGRRDEASRRARQFRERFPGSLMLEVIQSALDNEGH